MPSRWVTLGIVSFWLAASGWFFTREVWPYLAADAPPAFVIDITDEAVRQIVPIRWNLFRNGTRLCTVRTWMTYHDADDTFYLTSSLTQMDLVATGPLKIHIGRFEHSYHVNRAGEMLGSKTDVEMTAIGLEVKLKISAVVRGQLAYPECRLEYPGGVAEPQLNPIPVARVGVLNPLHPVNRVVGLRAGMRWQIPLNDSLSDVRRAVAKGLADHFGAPNLPLLSGDAAPQILFAEVLGPLGLEQSTGMVDCFVIDYRGDDFRARTWVRQSDGTVLRQEATNAGDEFILQRE